MDLEKVVNYPEGRSNFYYNYCLQNEVKSIEKVDEFDDANRLLLR